MSDARSRESPGAWPTPRRRSWTRSTPQQRELAAWPFPSDDERRRWFYTPTDHGGLPLSAMRPAQQRLAFRLVAAGLSRPGYVTVATIIGLENVLDELEGWTAQFERERGRDPGLYYLRVFGEPSGDGPWSWRFGGHHVSINHLIVDGAVEACDAAVPRRRSGLVAAARPAPAAPARRRRGPRPRARPRPRPGAARRRRARRRRRRSTSSAANRPRVEDGDRPLALIDVWRAPFQGELGDRMRATQERAEQAVGLRAEHLDAVSFTTTPKGVAASALDRRPAGAAARRSSTSTSAGSPTRSPTPRRRSTPARGSTHSTSPGRAASRPGEPHYYRIQGPRLLAEYDNTQRNVNHVHSVWRDPDGDFGDDVLARHYREAASGHGHS